MRFGMACLALCASSVCAVAENQAPMPDFFQKSWDAAAAKPLQLMSPVKAPLPTRSIVPLAPPTKATFQPTDDLPGRLLGSGPAQSADELLSDAAVSGERRRSFRSAG